MLKDTGGLFFSTYLKVMVTVTTTTLRPHGWRPVCSPPLPVVFWPLATSHHVHSSMSTTGCWLWILVINTGASLWTLSSCQVLVHAIFHCAPFDNFSYDCFIMPRAEAERNLHKNGTANNISVSFSLSDWLFCDKLYIAIFVVRVAVS